MSNKNPIYIKEIAPLDPDLDFGDTKVETEESSLLDRLKTELAHPLLNMLKRYLYASRSHENKKMYICLAEFRKEHPGSFRLVFIGDLLLQFLYLSIFIATVLRGLGFADPMLKSIDTISNNIHEFAIELVQAKPCATQPAAPVPEMPLEVVDPNPSTPPPVNTTPPTLNP